MFFDNASTTMIDQSIIDEFDRLNKELYYNAGGLYSKGRNVKGFIEDQRNSILHLLNADEGRLIFTGSATEGNNLALFGSLKKNIGKILISIGEHPSVYNTALEIKSRGFDVDFIKLGKDGKIDFEHFQSLMDKNVGFISVMHVSNETGAINDIARLVDYAKRINPKVIFHCDGVQAVGKINIDLEELGVDMYTMSAHKIHGMKGVGALYVKKDVSLKPIIFGGGQESGLRSGTENLLAIYSLSKAVENSISLIDENYKKVYALKTTFLNMISNSNLKYKINSMEDNSPYIVSISFLGCRAETLLNMLDDNNIYIGNGSACSSKNSGNRILESMGCSKSEIEGNLRISFSKYNTIEEVEKMVDVLIDCINRYLSKV